MFEFLRKHKWKLIEKVNFKVYKYECENCGEKFKLTNYYNKLPKRGCNRKRVI